MVAVYDLNRKKYILFVYINIHTIYVNNNLNSISSLFENTFEI